MNYSEMKDHEINAAVGEAIGWNAKFIHQDDSVTFRDDLGRLRGRKNYCNSWADAGPIIFNHGISIMKDSGLHLWCATSSAYWADGCEWQMGPEVMDSNPLRAAMIVFLMMQEAK